MNFDDLDDMLKFYEKNQNDFELITDYKIRLYEKKGPFLGDCVSTFDNPDHVSFHGKVAGKVVKELKKLEPNEQQRNDGVIINRPDDITILEMPEKNKEYVSIIKRGKYGKKPH